MVEEILEIMEKRGITKKEMAEMIGISENGFYRRADALSDFTVSELEKMCEVLGVRFQLFHTGKGWDIEAWRARRDVRHPRSRRRPVPRECGDEKRTGKES